MNHKEKAVFHASKAEAALRTVYKIAEGDRSPVDPEQTTVVRPHFAHPDPRKEGAP